MKASELTAGPELDGLIAEKLFGWEWRTGINDFRLLVPADDSQLIYSADMGPYQRVPPFSTVWHAAMLVEERVRRDLWEMHLNHRPDGRWVCDLCIGLFKGWVEGAPTGPLAICRAAMGALGFAEDSTFGPAEGEG